VARSRVSRDDVARLAGVSTALVSYVINDGPRPVAPATRARVLRAVEELGYRPNHVARSLRAQRTFSLGILVPEVGNPFYAEVAKGIEDEVFGRGYTLTVGNTQGSAERRRSYTQNLIERRVDAIFFDFTGVGPDELELLERSGVIGIYIGTIDELPDGVRHQLPSVTMDGEPAGYEIGRRFVDQGHTRVACIVSDFPPPPMSGAPWRRVEGVRRALREASLDAVVVSTGQSLEDGYRTAAGLLAADDRPTAIFAFNDVIATGVLRRAADEGLVVPDDLAVCGFDDIELARFLQPRLTTVAVPKAEMGSLAERTVVEALDRKLEPDELAGRDLTVDLHLVVRDSG
jgi:LacI family transcriptional regulator